MGIENEEDVYQLGEFFVKFKQQQQQHLEEEEVIGLQPSSCT